MRFSRGNLGKKSETGQKRIKIHHLRNLTIIEQASQTTRLKPGDRSAPRTPGWRCIWAFVLELVTWPCVEGNLLAVDYLTEMRLSLSLNES